MTLCLLVIPRSCLAISFPSFYLFIYVVLVMSLMTAFCADFIVACMNIRPIVSFTLVGSFAALFTLSFHSISKYSGIHINVNLISLSFCSFSIYVVDYFSYY